MADNNDFSTSKTPDKDLAAEVIRGKIEQLYADEIQKEVKEEKPTVINPAHSEHQQFINQLINSKRSLPEIQTAWHDYYVGLPDDQKHQVWQEFYAAHAKARQTQQAAPVPVPPNKPAAKPKAASPRTVSQLKDQLVGKANSRGKLGARQHFQALLFGLATGSIVIILLLFSFFNERIIAPFIQPSRTVSNTPIILTGDTAVGPNPEIIIPKINVEIPVVYNQPSVDENAIESSLEQGVVHYATTPYPGQLGNGVIFGHSSNNILNPGKYKFAFVLLHTLNVGDTFYLIKDGKRYVYQVYKRDIVSPNDVSVMNTQDQPATFTLITCDPPGTSINRLVVVGKQISPDPSTNTTSTATKVASQPAFLPSNSISLWSRLTGWL